MTFRKPLDRDLALTEISLQAASLAASVRRTVAESARRIASAYPSSGLKEEDITSQFERLLALRGTRLTEAADGKSDGAASANGDSHRSLTY